VTVGLEQDFEVKEASPLPPAASLSVLGQKAFLRKNTKPGRAVRLGRPLSAPTGRELVIGWPLGF
jgi:hypothetical protein